MQYTVERNWDKEHVDRIRTKPQTVQGGLERSPQSTGQGIWTVPTGLVAGLGQVGRGVWEMPTGLVAGLELAGREHYYKQ